MRSARRGTAVLAFLVAWLGLLVGAAGPAAAHAALISTDPPSGAHLARAPDHVSFTFSEHVTLVRDGLKLVDATGKNTTLPGATSVGSTVRVPLPAISDGAYVVSYRVVSADTHPVGGSIAFTVGTVAPGAAPPLVVTQKPGTGLRAAGGIDRWVSYAGAIAVIGVPVFVGICWPAGRTSRRLVHLPTAGAVAVVAAALVGLPVQAARSTGNSFVSALHDGSISDVLRTPYGHAAEERILCAVLAAGLWAWWRTQPRRQLALAWLVAAVALALGYSKAGHPAVGRWPGLTLADDVAHLSAVAIWLGGLAVLAACVLPAPPEGCVTVLRRWSRLAMVSVVVLVATGVIQAWRELRSVHALVHHSYGQWVLLKVGLLALMVALGNLGRRRVQRYVTDDATATMTRMRQGVFAEVGIGAAVLVATSALVVTNPGPVGAHSDSAMAGMAGMASMPAVVSGATDLPIGVHVEVRVTNPMAGTPTIEISTTRNGKPVKAAAVEVRAGLPTAGVEPIPLTVVKLAVGSYEVRKAPLSIPGQWVLIITVRTSNIDAGVGSISIQLY